MIAYITQLSKTSRAEPANVFKMATKEMKSALKNARECIKNKDYKEALKHCKVKYELCYFIVDNVSSSSPITGSLEANKNSLKFFSKTAYKNEAFQYAVLLKSISL